MTPTFAPAATPAERRAVRPSEFATPSPDVAGELVPPPLPRPPRVEQTLPIRIERRVSDDATAEFAAEVMRILTDERGWVRAGFHFVEDPSAAVAAIVLAEGPEVDALCQPLDTAGKYSCQNGPVVALNADRWREATSSWPSSLEAYRTMLVNHEVGHLLHLHHPDPQCPGPGLPAPVMAQQSTTLDGCAPNPWPLRWEVRLAAARLEPLAPPADHDPSDHRPSPPPARR